MDRCEWSLGSELEMKYHDEEWGQYRSDDANFFEFLVLESFQAGLSWNTVLVKREAMREAYFGFDAVKLSQASSEDVAGWISNASLIRSERKCLAMIGNAQVFLDIVQEFGCFETYLKVFIPNLPIHHHFKKVADVPTVDEASTVIANDLKKRGFKYMGPVIMYAFLQATGVYNDHVASCFRA